MRKSIIEKLRKANLTGRGGASFPVALKWETVKKSPLHKDQNGNFGGRFVVCNASEGEPQVEKDFYILKNYPKSVITGMEIAMDYLSSKQAYLYLNPNYYSKLRKILEPLIKNKNITLFKKSHTAGYVGGEESSALAALEGKKVEPRLKPPFPAECGLFLSPTLVNNVETFFYVSMIYNDKYKTPKRFFTVNGDSINHGVFELLADFTIEQVLKRTDNYPEFDFFVQVGGGVSGEVLNSTQLERPVSGSGSITIHSFLKHDALKQIRTWIKFFKQESCGQCVPCREGTYRLNEIINQKNINWKMLFELLNSLRLSSFCGLGLSVSIPIFTYVQNVLCFDKENKLGVDFALKKSICDSFDC